MNLYMEEDEIVIIFFNDLAVLNDDMANKMVHNFQKILNVFYYFVNYKPKINLW